MQLRGKSVRSWCDGSSDRSFMVDSLSYFSTGVTNAIVYAILSVGVVHIKQPLLLISKSSLYFLSRYLNGPLPYVRRHITLNKMSAVK